MGRPKVKEKKPPPLASSKDESATGDNDDSAPSNPRKRGRPRKAAQDEMDREGSTEIASLSEKDVEKKRTRQKDSGAPTVEEKTDANGASLGNSQPITAKRDGNRRKGNPRRAAGASLDLK